MKVSKKAGLVAAALCVVAGVALAGNQSSTDPTADITDPARSVDEMSYGRGNAQDSTLAGGVGASLPSQRIGFPNACSINLNAPGCSGFCAAHPTDPLCVGGTPPPVTPPTPGPTGHCGLPPNVGYNANPRCRNVSSPFRGWMCSFGPGPGAPEIFIACP